jgi:hypothetical protein
MLKKNLTYENFDGETVTKTCWFHLSVPEWTRMEAAYSGGLQEHFKQLVEAGDNKKMVEEFENLIFKSYGERDGDRFAKSDEISLAFSQSLAYEALFMELVTDLKKVEAFILGVLPKELADQYRANNPQDKPTGPPPTPSIAPPSPPTP